MTDKWYNDAETLTDALIVICERLGRQSRYGDNLYEDNKRLLKRNKLLQKKIKALGGDKK